MIEILEEICRGEGAFRIDPLEHADNVIENNKELAKEALEIMSEVE